MSFSRLLVVSVIFFLHVLHAIGQNDSSAFERLAQQAEMHYRASNVQASAAMPPTAGVDLAIKKRSPIASIEAPATDSLHALYAQARKRGLVILSDYEDFSTEWWEKLFAQCKGCENFDRPINCDILLEANEVWRQVEARDAATKQIVSRRAIRELENRSHNGPCVLACAMCVGGNPNERKDPNVSDNLPHTALHMAAMAHHIGLFRLLLEKGADPNLLCAPAHPLNFVDTQEERDLLREYGAETPVRDDVY